MLRVLIREEQQICVTKVPVSSFYVIPLSLPQSNTVLIKLFLDSCFLSSFHIYQKLARTFAPTQAPNAKDFYVSSLGHYFKRRTKKNTKKKKRIVCPAKKKPRNLQLYNGIVEN